MVSAAKLRRAQDRVIAARPYAAQMREMLANLAQAAQSDERASESAWLAKREPNVSCLAWYGVWGSYR